MNSYTVVTVHHIANDLDLQRNEVTNSISYYLRLSAQFLKIQAMKSDALLCLFHDLHDSFQLLTLAMAV